MLLLLVLANTKLKFLCSYIYRELYNFNLNSFVSLEVRTLLFKRRLCNQGAKYLKAIEDVANSKCPLLIILKVQLRLRVTCKSATALARYPQKLA